MVVWLIGLSGAGKSTIGHELWKIEQERRSNIVFMDGDIFREIMGSDLGFDLAQREKNAWRICRFCKALDDQGIDVVFAILSLFPETRHWMRENVSDYVEVFIDAPLSELEERDSKGLYRKFKNGEIKNVVGCDIPFPPPETPDLVIENRKPLRDPGELALEISSFLRTERSR